MARPGGVSRGPRLRGADRCFCPHRYSARSPPLTGVVLVVCFACRTESSRPAAPPSQPVLSPSTPGPRDSPPPPAATGVSPRSHGTAQSLGWCGAGPWARSGRRSGRAVRAGRALPVCDDHTVIPVGVAVDINTLWRGRQTLLFGHTSRMYE